MTDDKPITPPNQALHDYVTSGVFTLTLHKSHVAMLAHLYEYQDRPFTEASMSGNQLPIIRRMFVTACGQLQTRGLVTHHAGVSDDIVVKTLGDAFKLTKAGRAAIVLLKESGLIDPKLQPRPSKDVAQKVTS